MEERATSLCISKANEVTGGKVDGTHVAVSPLDRTELLHACATATWNSKTLRLIKLMQIHVHGRSISIHLLTKPSPPPLQLQLHIYAKQTSVLTAHRHYTRRRLPRRPLNESISLPSQIPSFHILFSCYHSYCSTSF